MRHNEASVFIGGNKIWSKFSFQCDGKPTQFIRIPFLLLVRFYLLRFSRLLQDASEEVKELNSLQLLKYFDHLSSIKVEIRRGLST